jgi:RNA polymerase sigma-70 factor, ECF subfamily
VRDEAERSFSEFVGARMPALLRYAHVLTGDRSRAEDIVQHALAAAYRHWRRVTPDGAEAYVRHAILNTTLSWRRRASVRRERPVDVVPEPALEGASRASYEERDAMWRALATLPARQRAVLVLRYYEDLSEAEIARTLGVAAGTVKSQAARGLARLRAHLAPDEPDPPPAVLPRIAEEPR